jgi:hypothetical protein
MRLSSSALLASNSSGVRIPASRSSASFSNCASASAPDAGARLRRGRGRSEMLGRQQPPLQFGSLQLDEQQDFTVLGRGDAHVGLSDEC